VVAVLVRQEIVLAIMGGVFVAETVSVAMQVLYFKYSAASASSHGAAAPSLRTEGLGGAEDHRALLDRDLILVLIGLSTLKVR